MDSPQSSEATERSYHSAVSSMNSSTSGGVTERSEASPLPTRAQAAEQVGQHGYGGRACGRKPGATVRRLACAYGQQSRAHAGLWPHPSPPLTCVSCGQRRRGVLPAVR